MMLVDVDVDDHDDAVRCALALRPCACAPALVRCVVDACW